jgi:hypothetical protein
MDTINADELAAAKRQSDIFAGTTTKAGKLTLRKPPAAGLHILATAGNRFVMGMSADELTELGLTGANTVPNGNIIKYCRDVWQWVAVCTASPVVLGEWFDDPSAFAAHVRKTAIESPLDMAEITHTFAHVLAVIAEVNETQVTVRKEPTKHAGPPKKKALNRHGSRSTRSR